MRAIKLNSHLLVYDQIYEQKVIEHYNRLINLIRYETKLFLCLCHLGNTLMQTYVVCVSVHASPGSDTEALVGRGGWD